LQALLRLQQNPSAVLQTLTFPCRNLLLMQSWLTVTYGRPGPLLVRVPGHEVAPTSLPLVCSEMGTG
jgi:hypothetical protein